MKGLYFFPLLILLTPLTIQETGSNYRGLASSWNVIQSRSLAGLHYIFKGFEVKEELGIVKVTGPVIEIIGGDHLRAKVHQSGFTAEMDPEDFEEEQALALGVFEATTRTGTDVGTAFLVGSDLVLTNRHVMAYAPNAKELDCGRFSIKLNHREERVTCERVRFCSSKYDYCVIEMKKLTTGLSLSSEVKPLRLTQRIKSDPDILLLHIGNAAGLGIQASRGKGFLVQEGEFYHYAPALGGSSGAPILNEKGEVLGINWGHTGGNYLGESSFNRGVLMQTIFKELYRKGYHRTLHDIKSFRSWLARSKGNRRVSIVDPKPSKSLVRGK